MNALKKLQDSVLFQLAASAETVDKLSPPAREHVIAGVVLALAVTFVGQAHADSPLNPSNCAGIGGATGAAVGAALGKHGAQQVVGGLLGGFAGAVGGHYLCRDTPRQQPEYRQPQSQYPQNQQLRTQQDGYPGDGSYQQRRPSPREIIEGQTRVTTERLNAGRQPLSMEEYQALDRKFSDIMVKKRAWTAALESVEFDSRANPAQRGQLQQAEAHSRANFVRARDEMAKVLFKLASPQNNYDVSVYTGVMASLMEIPTDGSTTIRGLQHREAMLITSNPAYASEYNQLPPTRTRPAI